jgi:hypothetical protein
MAAGAGGDGYLGAWSGPEPKTDADLKPSPDGFATHTVVQRKSAVDFIVDTVKANPNEITILDPQHFGAVGLELLGADAADALQVFQRLRARARRWPPAWRRGRSRRPAGCAPPLRRARP